MVTRHAGMSHRGIRGMSPDVWLGLVTECNHEARDSVSPARNPAKSPRRRLGELPGWRDTLGSWEGGTPAAAQPP